MPKKKKKKFSKKKKIKARKKRKTKTKKLSSKKIQKNKDNTSSQELIFKIKPEWIKSSLANKLQYQNKYKDSIKNNNAFWKKEGKRIIILNGFFVFILILKSICKTTFNPLWFYFKN